MTEQKQSHSESQAKAQLESIREMVAALECDYDRLEELRDERGAILSAITEAEQAHGELPDAETAKALAEAQAELASWDEDNGEELADLEAASKIDDEEVDADKARERIQEDALSIEVRSGWTTQGEPLEAEEFAILLCTGGPAVRIRGELSGGEPTRAWLEHQDWGTSWQEYIEPGAQDALLAYARCFYFGE